MTMRAKSRVWASRWAALLACAGSLGACSQATTENGPNTTTADVQGGGTLDIEIPDGGKAEDTANADAALGDSMITDGALTDTAISAGDATGQADGDAKTDTAQKDTWAQDLAAADLTAADVPAEDVIPEDTAPALPELATCPGTITVTSPKVGSFIYKAANTTFKATVAGAATPATLQVQWSSDVVGYLGTSAVDAAGATTFSTNTLPQGPQVITAIITTGTGICASGDGVKLGVCSEELAEDFNANISGGPWVAAKDATWDPGGWMELTGIEKSKAGAIYNSAAYVTPGDASMRFSIQTGGGINAGADGFAMTVLQAKSLTEVSDFLNTASNGGCLGYGLAPPCGSSSVVAFHVEFDTFHNVADPFPDPTYNDHIGILLNGNAADHKAYVDVPDLEDFLWHDVRIDVSGTNVTVYYDGVEKLSKAVPELDFRGGYVIFTGSTGWATNYHRFDNLQILHKCK